MKAENDVRSITRTVLDSFVMEPNRPASVQVFDHLRSEIIRGRIVPGTALSEASLCRAFSVSRQPVREALLRLSTENLIRIYPQRGSVVAPITVSMVLQAQVIREAVEVEMVSRAMKNRTDAFLSDLRTELQIQRTLVEAGDSDRFFASDQNFHRRICEQSGISGVWESLQASRSQLDRVRHVDLQMSHVLSTLIDQHQAIYDGFAEGDTAHAVAAMRAHLRRVLDSLDRTIQRAPNLFEGASPSQRSSGIQG